MGSLIVFVWCSTAMAQIDRTENGFPTVELSMSEPSQVLKIRLSNPGPNALEFYNSLHDTESRLPYFLYAFVETSDGRVLTEVDNASDLYVGLNIMESTILFHTVSLSSIASGQVLVKHVPLRAIAARLDGTLPALVEQDHCRMRFRLRLCVDEELQECRMSESDTYKIDLASLRTSH